MHVSAIGLGALQQAMDPNSPTPKCESACREIRSAWSQLNLLGRALACRSAGERRQIKETYRAMYGEDLVEHLQEAAVASEEENEMCTALYLWMLEPHERDAVLAKDAVECGVTDCKALVEIYTRRRPTQLFFTKQAYLTKFRRHLDQDVITEPSQPYQKILLALSASHKSHQTDVSRHIAKCDAKRLYEAGNGGGGGAVDESVILEILSKRSIPQLRLAFSSYKHIYGHEYIKALKKKNSGEFEDSLRIVVSCIYSPSEYYSKMVHRGLQKGDANRVLTRAMIGGTDVGMREVRSAFEKRYGRRMQDAISEGLPEGDLRDFLVALADYAADHTS